MLLQVLLLLAQSDATLTVDSAQKAGAEIADIVTEASRTFGMPTAWIYAVMSTESANRPHAKSEKGAMGLMQLMPATWQDLRAIYRLGNDPYDPHANIFGGTAYLRAMYDRYGPHGFLAAYNAGPARYEAYLRTGGSLPDETRLYVKKIEAMIRLNDAVPLPMPAVRRIVWTEAPLFLGGEETPNSPLPTLELVPVSTSAQALFPSESSRKDSDNRQVDQEN